MSACINWAWFMVLVLPGSVLGKRYLSRCTLGSVHYSPNALHVNPVYSWVCHIFALIFLNFCLRLTSLRARCLGLKGWPKRRWPRVRTGVVTRCCSGSLSGPCVVAKKRSNTRGEHGAAGVQIFTL